MEDAKKQKLANLLEFEKKFKVNPPVAILQENEKVISAIQEVDSKVNETQDAVVKIYDTVNGLEQNTATKKELEYAMASVQTQKGDRGFKGETGEKGDKGDKGEDGKDGIDGLDGAKGDKGETGSNGKDGKDGSPDTPDQVIEKIHTSKKLIKKEKIEGIDDLEAKLQIIANRPQVQGVGGGASGVRDIRAGTNVTVSKNNEVYTISASGGAATDELVKLNASDPTAGYLDDKVATYGFLDDASQFATSAQGLLADTALQAETDPVWESEKGDYATTASLADYAKLDGSNQPFTGDVEIEKEDPTIKLTHDSKTFKIERKDTEANIINSVDVLAGAGNAVYPSAYPGLVTVSDSASLDLTTQMSISMWVYPTTNGMFIQKDASDGWDGGWGMGHYLTNRFWVRNYTNCAVGATLTLNQWSHVVGTYDGQVLKMYVNGSKGTDYDYGSPTAITTNNANVIIPGGRGGNYGVKGRIDEVQIWDKALTQEEVTALYNSGTGKIGSVDANTVALWHFDEASGTSANDESANNNDGSLSGTITFNTGLIYKAGEAEDVEVITVENGTAEGERGVATFGITNGKTIINGGTVKFNVDGSEQFEIDDSGDLVFPDNQKTYFGTAKDSSVYYNGTNLIVNPKDVGSGILDLQGGLKTAGDIEIDKTSPKFTLTNGNDYTAYIQKNDTLNNFALKSDILTQGSSANLIPTMTSNTAPNGVTSASGTFSGAFPAWHAADKDNATKWVGNNSSTTTPSWWKYQFATASIVDTVSIRARSDTGQTQTWKDFQIQASNDDTNWTTLSTQTNISWSLGQTQSFSFSNATSYTYYRIIGTSSGGYGAASEISFQFLNPVKTEATLLSHDVVTDDLTKGKITLGNNDSILYLNGTKTIFQNKGTDKFSVDTSGDLVFPDNQKTYLGTAKDASIYYDGTDLIINPKDVGSGGLKLLGNATLGAINYAADAQASDTYVITLAPAPTAYTTGMQIIFKANTANTGEATLNVNSLGAKTIVKGVSTALSDNDILASMLCLVVYDGTNFVLMNPRAL